jgi:hypothetical protein
LLAGCRLQLLLLLLPPPRQHCLLLARLKKDYVCRKPTNKTNKQATGPYKWVNQLSKLLVICLITRAASINVCGIIN